MDEIFKEIDKNHDGVIELCELVPDACPRREKPNPMLIFKTLDINHDGKIKLEEMEMEKSIQFMARKHPKTLLQTKINIKS